MEKRHKVPLSTTLLTTALLGFGALPALADVSSLLDDISAQNAGHHFTLTVEAYASGEADIAGDSVGLTTGILTDLNALAGTTATADFQMFCVDFNHDIRAGQTYAINIESLIGVDPPDPSPPGLGESMTTLRTQALLGADFGTTPHPANIANDIAVQHDIWNLSPAPGPIPPFTDDTGQLAIAQGQLSTASFTGAFLFDIVTTPSGSPLPGQAFMPVDPTGFNPVLSSSPEPGTLVMLGLGLIGLGSRKLLRSKR